MARSARLSIRIEPELAAAVTAARGLAGTNAWVRAAIIEKLERDVGTQSATSGRKRGKLRPVGGERR